jgi:hypothetical protein
MVRPEISRMGGRAQDAKAPVYHLAIHQVMSLEEDSIFERAALKRYMEPLARKS